MKSQKQRKKLNFSEAPECTTNTQLIITAHTDENRRITKNIEELDIISSNLASQLVFSSIITGNKTKFNVNIFFTFILKK